jgi:dolichol-phosphate mannosyltransferase
MSDYVRYVPYVVHFSCDGVSAAHDQLHGYNTGRMPSPLVSVVLSFRNEAETLPALIARLAQMFATQPVDYELIFVNDASTDASLQVLTAARESNARIKILTMARRFGVAECVRAGMAVARGDAVVYMDTDLQDPPEVIPSLLAEWHKGAEVVHTIRTRREGESQMKMRLTALAYRLIRSGSTLDLPVDAGDFKLLSRKALTHVLALPESDPYLRGLTVWIGFRQVLVPYVREARHSGTTHFPFFSRNPWKTFLLGLTSFSFMPIYAIAILAAIGAMLTVGVLAIALWLVATGSSGVRTTSLIAAGLLLWTLTVAAIGIVGLYVIRIYKDVRGRPQYIVSETVGLDDAPK